MRLGAEFTVAEYRNGNDPENHVREVVGVHEPSDTTVRRGRDRRGRRRGLRTPPRRQH